MSKRSIIATVGVQQTNTTRSVTRLLTALQDLHPDGQLMAAVLRYTLVIGILRKIRTRALIALAETLQTEVVRGLSAGSASVDDVKQSAVARARVMSRLTHAYNKFDKMVLNGSAKQIAAARTRVMAAQQDVLTLLSQRTSRDRSNASPRLRQAVVTQNLMRSRALAIIEELTNISAVSEVRVVAHKGKRAAQIGVGQNKVIEQVETPSATLLLSQKKTSSKKKMLFRHLEFGTGVYAVASEDYTPYKTMWVYGGTDTSNVAGAGANAFGARGAAPGLMVKGSKPMHMLWGPKGQHDLDLGSAQLALEEAMQQLMPKFTSSPESA